MPRKFRYQRNLSVTPRQLAEFCKQHSIVYLGLFGSVVHDDFNDESDVDVLYEFKPGMTPGIAMMDVIWDLEKLVGRKIDFVPRLFLAEPFKSAILPDVETVYEERPSKTQQQGAAGARASLGRAHRKVAARKKPRAVHVKRRSA
ncbi:MAG: nucleotidyltransferase domain-containing protein [Planctomycetes bacterium]|nr:nucleotidyltransferase domain-containing protein [Planctomycetota bacterium]